MKLKSLSLVLIIALLTQIVSWQPEAARGQAPTPANDLIVYDDAIRPANWADWSWGCQGADLTNTNPVYQGTYSLGVTLCNPWSGLYLTGTADTHTVDLTGHKELSMAIYPTTQLKLWLSLYYAPGVGGPTVDPESYVSGGWKLNQWNVIKVPLTDLNAVDTPVTGVVLMDGQGQAWPKFYVDEVRFLKYADTTAPAVSSASLTTKSAVKVTYNEKVNPTDATSLTNYALTSTTDTNYLVAKTPTAATINTTNKEVTLSFATALTVGGSYVLAATNIRDIASPANTLLNSTTAFTANLTGYTVTLDSQQNRKAINPLIYGLAHAPASSLSDLNVPFNRWGGNNTSRYNWQDNADNRGMDWYFESLPYDSATPAGEATSFINATLGAGAEPNFTIPMIDWVAKLAANRGRLSSYSVAKYGPQTDNDAAWFPDAGNGILRSTNRNITTNDPNDANRANSPAFQQGLVQQVANNLTYYTLDNEHALWNSTHRDVHPSGATMDEVLGKMTNYATMIKAADPNAKTIGPEEWGWTNYLVSGADSEWANTNGWDMTAMPDRRAHGGMDYMPWLLDQMKQKELQAGKRLLDIFSLHIYPQNGEYSDDISASMQAFRNRSTRALWDPNYTDESWINEKVRLIPRMKEWVAAYYPGTQTAITEYNWGAERHINGATALADIWGIFGREGLDMANYWTNPPTNSPVSNAMKLYRNYDGSKSTFGDVSIGTTSAANADDLSVFGAERTSDGALTVMIINKHATKDHYLPISLQNFTSSGTAQVWQLTSTNAITRGTDLRLTGNQLDFSASPQSITLLVIPRDQTQLGKTALQLVKSVDKAVVSSGATLTYTLTYQNISAVDANNIVLTDPVPTASNYVAGSASNGGVESSRTVRWTIPLLKPGQSGQVSFQVTIQ